MASSREKTGKPIVYACSGCSNLAQMAHDIALTMDRDGIAEMSCISGVVGDVEPIVRFAKSNRPLIVIDGCSLACTRACCEKAGLDIDLFIALSDFGIEVADKKEVHFNESAMALARVYKVLTENGYHHGEPTQSHPHVLKMLQNGDGDSEQ